MVNFGGHVSSLAESAGNREFYLIPYNECKKAIANSEQFEAAWRAALHNASSDFQRGLQAIWADLFAKLPSGDDDIRGIPLGDALRKYAEHIMGDEHNNADGGNNPDAVLETMQLLNACYTSAAANAEGLRKLVKKHDKKIRSTISETEVQQSCDLTVKLLPELYASPFFTAEALLSDSIDTLRNSMECPYSTCSINISNDGEPSLKRIDSAEAIQQAVESRAEELEWLKRLAKSIPSEFIGKLVAHRGFHHIGDRNDKRPLENSTASMELCWTSGIPLCECDIALTKDERLVLAHDESFRRLALDADSPMSNKQVSDLTFRELISLPLKSGVRPPLLIDVLRSAHFLAADARLVIEIKPGNPEVASALSRLLIAHPELSFYVAAIISFDAVCMHSLREELSAEFVRASTGSGAAIVNPTPSRLSIGGNSLRRLSTTASSSRLLAQQLDDNVDATGPTTRRHLRRSLLTSNIYSNDDNNAINNVALAAGATTNNGDPQPKMPELLLLTVCDPPQHPSELQVGIDDYSPIESWICGAGNHTTCSISTRLDGIYLQYQPEMKTPEGARVLRELSQRHKVGVWMLAKKDPDDYETVEWLVKEGHVDYVNTDLPTSFRKGYELK